ncbi:hypothetical protein AMES_4091 [Amycolatopsis mediterranei S699]|uniref:ESX-1 secretion-associated protein n=2 Tax=Amycolatopsis mediterranei TaxID=33910 RepID=A0A0H3D5M2_AMYMU|nr:hypothetical protein [Amycolatopsis mediterranei]ADJ45916.1 hypothetical protein AMED_4139 [Amycolatopsis mediterranei U32]AEK42697.1 hypothetical protein RAM_21085 [Amycolatopsis mediterranei S699]AFO77627.1 hypothetical protein AMES_4091 [Amycolatopsis mediterranei S699]AGT84755.1 hypothetical protein B737_4091 [Amycolatopsis mediterranei RB]KDO05450.1 hypothetical protein DV26_38090 [Amycolatopsis mediterranei]
MTEGIQTNVGAISAYSKQLPFYEQEADKFGAKIDAADVTNEAWGLVGLFAKQGYTDRLAELRSLLTDLKDGVDGFTTKLTKAAEMYQGAEDAGKVTFGRYEAEIDAIGQGE